MTAKSLEEVKEKYLDSLQEEKVYIALDNDNNLLTVYCK